MGGTIGHPELDRAVGETVAAPGPHEAADWTVPAGPLKWTCRTTAAHIARDLRPDPSFALRLAARGEAWPAAFAAVGG